MSLVSIVGIVTAGGGWIVAWAAVLGFAGSAGLILALTLPALLSPPDMVATNASAMFALSYGTAVVVGVVSGAVWDLTGIPASAFGPIGLAALLLVGAALFMRRRGKLR
jgi:MYXO-CTERM domain-containing protein